MANASYHDISCDANVEDSRRILYCLLSPTLVSLLEIERQKDKAWAARQSVEGDNSATNEMWHALSTLMTLKPTLTQGILMPGRIMSTYILHNDLHVAIKHDRLSADGRRIVAHDEQADTVDSKL
jgi:hypothetical protein